MTATEFRLPVRLEGAVVALEPLRWAHVPELARAGAPPEIWTYLRIGPGRDEAEMGRLVASLLQGQATGDVLPFAVRRRDSGEVVGMFRYFHIDRESHNVELGTWLTPSVWRSPVNSDLKRTALEHAFEVEGCRRVALKTDARNERSRKAIERLGAQYEGTLRDHVVLPDGSRRSSAVYSILASEWPELKRRLASRAADAPGPGS
jgi:N-acetyltransferase